jgi:ADP-heptose:LPS heptosyltransferase
VLSLTAPSLRHLFEKYGFRSQEYFVVHPGMAGSALNWPTNHYVTLIEKLKAEKQILITGTAGDEAWIAPLRARFEKDSRVLILQGDLSIDELLFVLKNSAGVIAPSTGVAHLAASLGVPTVGIYSPIASQHPRRWGPRGQRAQFLLPDVPADFDPKTVTLEGLTPERVIECLKSL